MFDTFARRLLLAVFLVFAQVGAQVHAIEHLAESHHEQDRHGGHACAQCLAYGHVGAALPGSAPDCSDPTPAMPTGATPTTSSACPSIPAYLSRAPPR